MTQVTDFDEQNIVEKILSLSDDELDSLEFGVIGFDQETVVRKYSAAESRMAGLAPSRVVGAALFTTVAPCMNNFMVAQRFEDAAADGSELDITLDYVLTLKMRPSKVRLRLLAKPGLSLRYVLISRRV